MSAQPDNDASAVNEPTVSGSLDAAVIDTNFGTAGNFDTDRVKGLADRLRAHKIALWVPQQVIWEWAVHAYEGWEEIRREHRKLVLGGFASAQSMPAAVDLVPTLTERVTEIGAFVLPDFGESAKQAIRDQVLGTGPGRRENGVRTGAADSAWIRDTLEMAEGKVRKIVFLSRNAKDVLSTTRSMGFSDSEVVIAPNERELFDRIAGMVKASLEVTRSLADALTDLATKARGKQTFDTHDIHPPWFESSDLNVDRQVTERHEWSHVEYKEGVEIAVPQPEVIQVSNIRIDVIDDPSRPGVRRSAAFDLTLLGGVLLNGFSLEDGLAFSENYVGDVLIKLPCVMEEGDGNNFTNLRQTDTGTVSSALAQFDDQDEALRWTLEYLSSLEHIALEPVLEEGDANDAALSGRDMWTTVSAIEDGARYILRGPAGQQEIAVLDRDIFSQEGEWELHFEESKVALKCSYNHGATAWFDGGAYDLFPAYSVHAPRSQEPFSAIAAIWRKLLSDQESVALG